MFKVGDLVEQRDLVGHHGRIGKVLHVDGHMVRIEWEDGHESSFIPGPGALALLPRHGKKTSKR